MRAGRHLLLLILVVVMFACESMPSAMPDAESVETLADDERRLWAMSTEIDKVLERSGALYGDREVRLYLQSVMNDLFPEFRDVIQVRILTCPEANAFAMGNGSVYVCTGMLARLQSEAELAALLGHEGAHFTQRHILESTRRRKNAGILINTLGAATLIGGVFAEGVMAASSLSANSESNEADADAIGLRRMAAAGYDPRVAGNLFQRLANEMAFLGMDEPTLFRSHPKLETRSASLSALSTDYSTGGRVGATRFLEATRAARVAALEAMVRRHHGGSLIFLLSDPKARAAYGASGEFYLGEGYRLRDQVGDVELAMAHYQAALALVPEFGDAHARLGVIYLHAGRFDLAQRHFERFLDGEGKVLSREHVLHYLEQMSDSPSESPR